MSEITVIRNKDNSLSVFGGLLEINLCSLEDTADLKLI